MIAGNGRVILLLLVGIGRVSAQSDVSQVGISVERSDQYNFAKLGISALFFTSGQHPDYHQFSDTAIKSSTVRYKSGPR